MANSVVLEKAINWFFTEGYKVLSKNPGSSHQAMASSSISRIEKLTALMIEENPAEILVLLYEKTHRPRKFTKNVGDAAQNIG